jgi:16S rRNA (uracil1498-N3)-methyltransferase
LKPGDRIEVLNGAGGSLVVSLEVVGQSEVRGVISERREKEVDSQVPIILAQALLRFTKMDWVVQKATELGISQLIPLRTERTCIQGEGSEGRLNRWRRIAKESSEQCLRRTIPGISPLQDLRDFLEQEVSGRKILLWEGETRRRLGEAIRSDPSRVGYILLVGPEGGFSRQEVDRAESKGYRSVSLGNRILRAESVALVALSLLQYEKGDLA